MYRGDGSSEEHDEQQHDELIDADRRPSLLPVRWPGLSLSFSLSLSLSLSQSTHTHTHTRTLSQNLVDSVVVANVGVRGRLYFTHLTPFFFLQAAAALSQNLVDSVVVPLWECGGIYFTQLTPAGLPLNYCMNQALDALL